MDIIIPKRSLPRLLALTLAVLLLSTGLHARTAWAAGPVDGDVLQEGDDDEEEAEPAEEEEAPSGVINEGTCGDNYCDASIGEDLNTCAQDCEATCGDDVCNRPYERADSCPADCEATCGDGFCEVSEQEGGENACSEDCGEVTCGDGICEGIEWHGEDACTEDCTATCGDGYCDVLGGENSRNCEVDCQTPQCGDDACTRPFENAETCPLDCGPTCGDGWCEFGEAEGEENECLQDCPTTCGDGICEGDEWKIGAEYCGTDCIMTCGDGFCDGSAGETPSNCNFDCREAECGDGVCTRPEENLDTCSEDCTRTVCGDGLCTVPQELALTCADCVPAPLNEEPTFWQGGIVGIALLGVITTSWALASNINERRKVGRGPSPIMVILAGGVGLVATALAVVVLLGYDDSLPPEIAEGVTLLNCVCDGDTLICDGEEVADDHPACGQGALASGRIVQPVDSADDADADEDEETTDADDPTSTPSTTTGGGTTGGTTGGGTTGGGDDDVATSTPAYTCGNDICEFELGENNDLCNLDCQCTDDGVCGPGEGIGCADCGETAGQCGNICQDTSQCAEGLVCADGRCWGLTCDEDEDSP